MQLRDYQEQSANEVAQKLASGLRKIVFQLSTGAGKTVLFSAISDRYTKKSDKSILILVHRKELLKQTRRTLYKLFGINCEVIQAGTNYIKPAKVYVGMVESLKNRLKKIPTKIGMVLIDEVHLNNFNKIHDYFPAFNGTTTNEFAGTGEPYIIGFTATPLSANKKHPMKEFYQDIVCGIDIEALIKKGFLCQNITYAPKETVDRKTLSMSHGDFNEREMGEKFSKPQYINNTVDTYRLHADKTKALIFNVNIEHSIKVNNAFITAGYKSKHLDSEMSAIHRDSILNWFENTPGAILNNVGIATTGTDIPSVETICVNKATESMPLWIQMCGRGARTHPNKTIFTILDMGGNAITHGDFCAPRDWYSIFHNPPKKGDKLGVTPVKDCPKCNAILAASARICKFCGHEFPARMMELEGILGDFVIVTKNIDVHSLIRTNKEKKEYYPFFKIGRDLAKAAKNTIAVMNEENAIFILQKYKELGKEWCEAVGKKWSGWHEKTIKENLYAELQQIFKDWKPEEPIPVAPEPISMAPLPVPIAPDPASKTDPYNPFYIAPLKSLSNGLS